MKRKLKRKEVLKKISAMAKDVNPKGFDPLDVLTQDGGTLFFIGMNTRGDIFVDSHAADAVYPMTQYFASAAHADLVIETLTKEECETLFGVKKSKKKSTRKPEPQEADVLAVAKALLDSQGITTTLEVKNELRDLGFWVKQNTVSQLMKEVARNNNFDFNAVDRDGNAGDGLHLSYSYNY